MPRISWDQYDSQVFNRAMQQSGQVNGFQRAQNRLGQLQSIGNAQRDWLTPGYYGNAQTDWSQIHGYGLTGFATTRPECLYTPQDNSVLGLGWASPPPVNISDDRLFLNALKAGTAIAVLILLATIFFTLGEPRTPPIAFPPAFSTGGSL